MPTSTFAGCVHVWSPVKIGDAVSGGQGRVEPSRRVAGHHDGRHCHVPCRHPRWSRVGWPGLRHRFAVDPAAHAARRWVADDGQVATRRPTHAAALPSLEVAVSIDKVGPRSTPLGGAAPRLARLVGAVAHISVGQARTRPLEVGRIGRELAAAWQRGESAGGGDGGKQRGHQHHDHVAAR
jgi:hypothetical protein